MKTATAVISRRALRHNMQRVRQLAPNSRLVAVVKANAYGHGAVECATTLQDADCFGVARLSEALVLRQAGITKPILLLEGFFSADDLPLLAQHQLETAVHSIEQLEALEQADLPHPLTVWMKLDTGMHRLGVRPDKAEAFYQRLTQCRNVVQPVNIMSHFCRADEPEFNTTLKQIACFDAFTEGKPGAQSIAASGGILLWSQAHRNQVRPGIILYGVSPLANETATHFGLQPAMTLTSHLIAVREHKAGEAEGYGCIWTSEHDTLLGVVAMGYGDGYPRTAPFGTPVLVNGREVPLVGRVSMDMLTVDLGPDAQERVGDEVILWGEALPVERIAAHTKISAYELITRVTQRLALEYLDD
ncbi:alanine racemase [Candidatus Symbiopectobacterium sp. NZEC135]|uniref:alanine racemase n=1 Tax=Candidatus Symbiopectobacterium sp. NZEC135 TaxID=2820471 RepID=UPI002227D9CA|nr:alanine racemase [Candidatus Symbiopectobacterium sp. NZEC135]MCW2478874.1 alanine racemase [Candidatus Symbiopectobacterium sp. NZEC135]